MMFAFFLVQWQLLVLFKEVDLEKWHVFFAWYSFGMNRLWGLIYAAKIGFTLFVRWTKQ